MKKLIRVSTYIGIFGILTLLMSSCLTTGAGKNFTKYIEKQPYDAIIVPGVPFENGTWSDIMKIRVYWASHLYKQGIAKNIIFSGSSVYSPYVEAKIMSLYAQELGVAKEHIYIESAAEHSSENLYYSYKIAKKNQLNKVALATDPFQSSFLKGFAKKMMLDDLAFLPIVFDTLKMLDMQTPEINPTSAYVNNFESIVDRESFGKRLNGTMGKFIKYEQGDSPKEKRRKRKSAKKVKREESYTASF